MPTLYLEWNSDLVLTPNGSIQLAVGWDEIRQRIERRIITNPAQQLPDGVFTPADYIFDQQYGSGLGSEVAQDYGAASLAAMQQKITRGVVADAAVATNIPPTVAFAQPNPSTVDIFITVPLITGDVGEIQLQVSP